MTSQDWKEIIDGYDKEKETIISYESGNINII